jgi:2-polyprenyl-6-methoxyphenol hydroxylase-like FAD-dependent oxidoreductase
MGVVRLETWSDRRVGLLGDVAYCPTATTGMGTTSSLVGAYVLTGEIIGTSNRSGSSKETIPAALHAYEQRFRPFMKTVQDGIKKDRTYWHKMPSGKFVLAASNLVLSIVSLFRLDVLASHVIREDTGDWKLPDYEGMDFRQDKK